jgi:hypothetical protein
VKPDCPNCQANKCNHLDTNADVTTQTHDYLTGAYEERMRIYSKLQSYLELTLEPDEFGTVTHNPEWDAGFQAAMALVRGDNA